MYTRLNIAGISLNSAYRGRRFDTPKLKQFKKDMDILLPKMKVPKGKLGIEFIFGVSSKNSDTDNLIKCTMDSMATKYGFNDKVVYEIHVVKDDVKKGKEYIAFDIYSLEIFF